MTEKKDVTTVAIATKVQWYHRPHGTLVVPPPRLSRVNFFHLHSKSLCALHGNTMVDVLVGVSRTGVLCCTVT